jgi:hypothetical protein
MTDDVRNVADALDRISDYWQPRRLTSVNDYDVKVVKLQGEFVWHTHPHTDELFMVRSGHLTIQLRDRNVHLGPDDVELGIGQPLRLVTRVYFNGPRPQEASAIFISLVRTRDKRRC